MRWLDDLTHDARFAVRALVRSVAFAVATIATLAAGMSLAAAMFTVSGAVLRRPLPVEQQDGIVVLWGEAEGSIRRLPLMAAHFERFRESPRIMEAIGGVLSPRAWPQAVRDGALGLSWNMAAVTGNFFTVLGARPVLGRLLVAGDDVAGAPRVMVISHRLWRTHFGEAADAIGRMVTLHERDAVYTIVGVAPPGLEYPAGADFWVPITLFANWEVIPVARLVGRATPAHAAAELQASFAHEAEVAWRDLRAVATPLTEAVIGDLRPALRLLTASATLLLVIACVNVATLLVARATGRRHEFEVRRALGASRGRIARQILVESSILAGAAGLVAVPLAAVLLNGLVAIAPPELPRLDEIRLAGVSMRWTLTIPVAVAFVLGFVAPVLATRQGASLRDSAGSSGSVPGRRLQDALVVVQVGLAIVVLSAAGLLGRSLLQLQRVDLGFAADQVAIVDLAWPDTAFSGAGDRRAFYARVLPRIATLPQVLSAAPVHLLPFGGSASGIDGRFVADGVPVLDRASAPVLSVEVVGPNYFATMGIPLLRGRVFTDDDREDGPRVLVVTESVAREFWPGGQALGRRLAMGSPRDAADWWTVVGIVPDTRYRHMREPVPTVFASSHQFISAFVSVNRIAVRTAGDPTAVLPAIRAAVQGTDARMLVTGARTMNQLVARELAQPQLNTILVGVFGAGALALAAVGLYAVLAHAVRRRSRELAIRQALGASPSRLRSLVLRRAAWLAALGVFGGLVAVVGTGRLLQSLLFEVHHLDATTLASVTATVMAVALAASYAPARRAVRGDPASVLRCE